MSGHSVFDKGSKKIQWRKDVFGTNGAGTIAHLCAKPDRKKATIQPTLHIRLRNQAEKDRGTNVKCEATELLNKTVDKIFIILD